MTADLVIAALNMALFTRRPESVIHYSDPGRQQDSDHVRRAFTSFAGCDALISPSPASLSG